ncbi:MAG: DUF7002 family protein [Cellulomonas sp.]
MGLRICLLGVDLTNSGVLAVIRSTSPSGIGVSTADRLRDAPPYRGRSHDILVLDTAGLLDACAGKVELVAINSGAVHPGAKNARGDGDLSPHRRLPVGRASA